MLDVVIPVYNEETDLAPCIRRLHAYLAATFPYTFRITIADNASTDATPGGLRALRFWVFADAPIGPEQW